MYWHIITGSGSSATLLRPIGKVNGEAKIWGKAPRNDIAIKFGIGVDVHEIVRKQSFVFKI